MKKYRLKTGAPEFEAVDGKLSGRKFVHGKEYTEIPEADAKRFEEIKPKAPKKDSVPGPKRNGNGLLSKTKNREVK